MRGSNQCFPKYISEGFDMRSVDSIMNKLSPAAKALLLRGKVRSAIMISNLSALDKVLLMKYFEERR